MKITYIGRDICDRPVYMDYSGKLWKDTDPRHGKVPRLCTVFGNDFDGEPDTPMDAIKRYKDVQVEFEPKRDEW